MAMEGPRKGKVIGIVDGAMLQDVTFVVSESGRQRVIRERAKNVHAFVDGELVEAFALHSGEAPSTRSLVRITYDPYTMRQFIRTDCAQDVYESDRVVATPNGVFAKLPPCARARSRSLQGLFGSLSAADADDWNG